MVYDGVWWCMCMYMRYVVLTWGLRWLLPSCFSLISLVWNGSGWSGESPEAVAETQRRQRQKSLKDPHTHPHGLSFFLSFFLSYSFKNSPFLLFSPSRLNSIYLSTQNSDALNFAKWGSYKTNRHSHMAISDLQSLTAAAFFHLLFFYHYHYH